VTSKVEWGIFLRSGNNESNSSHISVLFNWMADADGMVRNTIVHYRSVLRRKDKTRHVTIFTTSKKHSIKEYKTATFDVFSHRYICSENDYANKYLHMVIIKQ